MHTASFVSLALFLTSRSRLLIIIAIDYAEDCHLPANGKKATGWGMDVLGLAAC
jgi:hypothetical protein